MGLKQKIRQHPIVVNIVELLGRIHFTKGVSLYHFLKILYQKLKDDDLQIMGAAIAFNFTLSLFPGVIFLFALIPYIPVEDLIGKVEGLAHALLPLSIYEFTWGTVEDIISKPRGGLLSFGVIMALYLAKNGMVAIMNAFNSCYSTRENRNFIKKQLIATGLTILLSLSMLLSIITLVLGNVIIGWVFDFMEFKNETATYVLVQSLRYGVIILLFMLSISIIYYFAPTVKKRFNFFSIGGYAATALILLVSQVFSFYVNNFANYNKVYGSIGALIGLMIFFYAISFILLIGFEINASIDQARHEIRAGES